MFIIQKRSKQVWLGPDWISVGIGEHMIRGRDEDEMGRPNPFITVQKCLTSELGVKVRREDIRFLGFGLRLDYGTPAAIGMVKIDMNSQDLLGRAAIDKWEGYNFAEDFSISAMKPFFNEAYPMSATAKLTILLALINQYGYDNVMVSFANVIGSLNV